MELKAENREEDAPEMWSTGLCSLLLLLSVNDHVIFSGAEESLQSQTLGFADYGFVKKSSLCLELNSW